MTYRLLPRTLPFGLAALALAAFAYPRAGRAAEANPLPLTVQIDRPGGKLNPQMYGLMVEEVNHSLDGGLYAELIRNRIFRDPPDTAYRNPVNGEDPPARIAALKPAPIPHWSAVTSGGARCSLATDTRKPVNTTALTTSLRLQISSAGAQGRAGVANDGYWGIPVRPNTRYRASFYARAEGLAGPLTVDIESNNGSVVFAKGSVPHLTSQWKKYELTLTTGNVTPSKTNRFVISAAKPGTVWLNLVSLFPPTYHNRPNGARVDLMEKFAGLHPAFLRFPGGNFLEGSNWRDRWNWKATVGPLEQRPGHMSPWGYRSSDGFGLLEYLEWCEDLQIQPVLAVFAGHIMGGGKTTVTGPKLQPYVQDALDEVEYVTGDVSTRWGARRARDGHPKPFDLTYVEIGNEDNFNNGLLTYEQRFAQFSAALKAKHPSLKLISTVPSGQFIYDRTTKPDFIDDHLFLAPPGAPLATKKYDRYSRATPPIMIGQWSSRDTKMTSSCAAAVADAIYLSSLERNGDMVRMACYGPLLVNAGASYPQYPGGPPYAAAMQWATDLIGYDGLNSFGSVSYYIQQMFIRNHGDTILPAQVGYQPSELVFVCASRVDATGELILKVINSAEVDKNIEINLQGAPSLEDTATGEVLNGAAGDVNSLLRPTAIVPKPLRVTGVSSKFVHVFPRKSVTVLRLKSK